MAAYNAPDKEGASITLGYTGTVDTLRVLKDGLYQFDVRGGAGGHCNWRDDNKYSNAAGGSGGRSIGYKFLKKGTILYPCIGGGGGWTGGTTFAPTIGKGGFNGGQNGSDGGDEGSGGSGGATHIATISGTLEQIGVSRISTILIVAGGAGGAYAGIDYGSQGGAGGSGGGLSGQAGCYNYDGKQSVPGTQTSGYAFGVGQPVSSGWMAPGGGGLYGGYSGSSYFIGGAGGSGYIGGVPSITYKGITYTPQTITGGGPSGNSAHGSIIVTLIRKGTPLVYLGDQKVDTLYYGDQEVDTLYYGDQEVN